MLRRWLRSHVGILDACGVLDLAQPWLSGCGLILMFHRVVEPGSLVFDRSLTIDSESLDQILSYIRSRAWDIISSNELYERLAGGKRQPRPFVCFTFDDGYADNLRVALPIFRRYQAQLCVNVAVGYIDRTTPAWWDVLGEMLSRRDEIRVSNGGKIEHLKVETWEEKVSAYHRLGGRIHEEVNRGCSPFGETWALNGIDPQDLSDRFFMTWTQLRELALDPLVQIGAHTVTHRPLTTLKENEAGDEIHRSRQLLEQRLGVKAEHFAYPFGSCGEREFRLIKELKFKTAVTTRWCNVFPVHQEHLVSLPRKFVCYGDVPVSTMRARLYGEDLSFES